MRNTIQRSQSLFLTLLLLFGQIPHAAAKNTESKSSSPAATEAYGKLPLSFESNEGQFDPRVKFASRGSGYSLSLLPAEAVLKLQGRELRMRIAGGNPKASIEGESLLPGKSNYLQGADRSQWRTGIANYSRVRYREIYPGIDLVFYGDGQKLEYDFIVAPGAEPTRIEIAFDGAERMNIDRNGDLVLTIAGEEIRQPKPILYQEVNGERKLIEGSYEIRNPQSTIRNRVGFRIGAFDPSRPLVIDPVLVYSSRGIGGGDIAVDGEGNAYLIGSTDSTAVPKSNPLQGEPRGLEDIYIAKLNAAGTALVFATYLGGKGSDFSRSISIDAAGNVYLSGTTNSTDFPGVGGGKVAPDQDAFVAKLNASGSALLYTTLIGGSMKDFCQKMKIDTAGNSFVVGDTLSPDLAVTAGAFQRTLGDAEGVQQDGFLARLNASGTITYLSYFGGKGVDSIRSLAVDRFGKMYVGGTGKAAGFPLKNPLPSTDPDGFVAKFDPDLFGAASLVYSTFLAPFDFLQRAGYRADVIDLDVDRDGGLYILGSGHVQGAPDAFRTINRSRYLARLNPGGTGFSFATPFGSILLFKGFDGVLSLDYYSRLIVAADGSIYVSGGTHVPIPVTPNAIQSEIAGGLPGKCSYLTFVPVIPCWDVALMKFNTDGSALLYSTLLGGESGESTPGIAVDSSGSVYLTGLSESKDFPVTNGAFASSFNDFYVTKIAFDPKERSATPAAHVSAASYLYPAPLAYESIVSAFGADLATTTAVATSQPLPTTLGGVTVTVDGKPAGIFSVSPNQVNYQIPLGATRQLATVTITNESGMFSVSSLVLNPSAPGIFTANANGKGVPAGIVIRQKPDGTQLFEPLARFDAAANAYVAVPIDLGPESDQVFVSLFGTGFRFSSALRPAKVKVGGIEVPILYLGKQPTLTGVDQLNIPLPRTLLGKGEVDLELTMDLKTTNIVRVNIK